jgi:uncharacterized protein (TIGR03435 family)
LWIAAAAYAQDANSPAPQETAHISIQKVDPTDVSILNRVSLQGFRAFAIPVRSIIVAAYCSRLTQRDFANAMETMRINDQGLQDDSVFNVEAIGPAWQMALQKTIEEQLGIKVRRITKPTSVYVLTVPPGGAAGLLSPGANVPDPSLAPPSPKEPDPEKFRDLPPALKHKLEHSPKGSGPYSWTKLDEAKGELDAVRSSVSSLTVALGKVLQRPVLDETGLAGEYDLRLVWGAKGPKELLRLLHDQLGLEVQEREETLEWLIAEKLDPAK